MATSLTSDSVHEYPCTSCAEEDINKEADVLCVTCNQYLCKTCLRFHNRMAGGKDHQFIDQDKFGHVTTANSLHGKPDLPTEICTKHHGKLIDMFCEDHDVVGCSVCMALDHRACKDVFYIPDIATSQVSNQTVQSVAQDLSEHLCKVKIFRADRHAHKSRLLSEKDEALKSVKERREKIDEHLDTRENIICKTVSDKYEEFCEDLDADINTCDDNISVLEKMKSKLLIESERNNMSQTFVNLKGARRTVKEAEQRRQASKEKISFFPKIKFQTGNSISDIFNPELFFGRVIADIKLPTGLRHEVNVNIRDPTDKHTCDCNDLCQLPGGTFILTDWQNNKIKSLENDTTYKLSGQLSMSSSPLGVCAVNENEVVVTMPNAQSVTFVSVDGGLSISISFKVTFRCTAIQHYESLLYIGDVLNSLVNIYDLKGNLLNTIKQHQAGSALFGKPNHMCLWPDKQQIVVADADKGIVVTDLSGQFITRYTYQNRNYAYGICFDDDSNIFIADYKSKKVVVLNVDKSTTTTLITLDRKPQAVYFHRNTGRLSISLNLSDYIQVFSVV